MSTGVVVSSPAKAERNTEPPTARLTVHYRRPTPLFRDLTLRAAVDRVEGRRIMSRAELWDGDTLTAQADGLFVRPTPERALEIFGHAPDEPAP